MLSEHSTVKMMYFYIHIHIHGHTHTHTIDKKKGVW